MTKLAIDFGTSVTKIFKLGSGIVLAEATCVTVDRATGEIRAYGNEAKRLLGKTAEPSEVRFPVYEGEICDERLASALLEYFLTKVGRRFSIEALFCVPCACSEASRAKYRRIAKAAGIARVSFVESPLDVLDKLIVCEVNEPSGVVLALEDPCWPIRVLPFTHTLSSPGITYTFRHMCCQSHHVAW